MGATSTKNRNQRHCAQLGQSEIIQQQRAASQMHRSDWSKATWVTALSAHLSFIVPPHSTLANTAWQHLAWTFGNLLKPH